MKRYRVYYRFQKRQSTPFLETSEVVNADTADIAKRNLRFRLLNDHPGPAVVTITRVEDEE